MSSGLSAPAERAPRSLMADSFNEFLASGKLRKPQGITTGAGNGTSRSGSRPRYSSTDMQCSRNSAVSQCCRSAPAIDEEDEVVHLESPSTAGLSTKSIASPSVLERRTASAMCTPPSRRPRKRLGELSIAKNNYALRRWHSLSTTGEIAEHDDE